MGVSESAQHGLANVGKSGESAQLGLGNVGESDESQHQHKMRRRCVREYSREYSQHLQNLHFQNLLSSGHCLDGTHVCFIFAVIWMPRKEK
jgi:hypothetical protein